MRKPSVCRPCQPDTTSICTDCLRRVARAFRSTWQIFAAPAGCPLLVFLPDRVKNTVATERTRHGATKAECLPCRENRTEPTRKMFQVASAGLRLPGHQSGSQTSRTAASSFFAAKLKKCRRNCNSGGADGWGGKCGGLGNEFFHQVFLDCLVGGIWVCKGKLPFAPIY